jgi:pseudouridylate synthase
MGNNFFQIGEDAANAIKAGRPVVTLESTIISFGLPYPQNMEVAFECEEIIREEGAVPATVGIVDGILKAGLSREEIKEFATRKDIVKTNLGNLSAICACGKWGATSVSTSLYATYHAGLKVFVTGGIGGVHKGFGESFDISSDLKALSQYPAIVVSAGIKTLLNVPATLERLETLGIPVLGYRTDNFPVFYISQSDYSIDMRVDSPEEVAKIYRAHRGLGLSSAIMVAVPVPDEKGMRKEEIKEALKQAEKDLSEKPEIKGRDVTPYLLNRLEKITRGKTLECNLALIRNNARTGAQIAKTLT